MVHILPDLPASHTTRLPTLLEESSHAQRRPAVVAASYGFWMARAFPSIRRRCTSNGIPAPSKNRMTRLPKRNSRSLAAQQDDDRKFLRYTVPDTGIATHPNFPSSGGIMS